MYKKVIRNTSILSLGTLVSRLLGFIRDILVAYFFGTSAILEAFIVAFRIPNLFRSIFAEGFSDAVATPVFSEYRKDKEKLFGISNHLICLFSLVLFLFTILGVIFSRYIVIFIAPGFIGQVHKFNLAVSFTRITFFYLFLIGISSGITSVLYALKKFFIPALNPAFLNISFIVGILFFSKFFKNYILVICVLFAGILQLFFPFVYLKREGFRLKLDFFASLKDKVLSRMLKLFIPRLWASITYHLSVFIDTIFSSLTPIVGEGALASVYYANRLIQFPFAFIALSLSRVAIVDLSSFHKEGKTAEFKKLIVFSFQNIIFFIIPIAVLFLFLSEGIIDLVFRRGAFSASSLAMTSGVLFFYSFGLFFFSAVKLFVYAFYSLKDTLTPAKTAAFSLVINAILSAVLMFPLKISGIALGSSLAAACNFFLLYRCLIKRVGKIDWEDTGLQSLKVILLSLSTGIIARLLWDNLILSRYLKILLVLPAVLILFIIGGFILRVRQIRYLERWVLRRK